MANVQIIPGTNQYIDPVSKLVYNADQIEQKQIRLEDNGIGYFYDATVAKSNARPINSLSDVGFSESSFDPESGNRQLSRVESLNEEVWIELAKANGIEPTLTFTQGSGENATGFNYTNPEFIKYVQQKKAEGLDVSVKQAPGYEYQFDVVVTQNGQPVGKPTRVQRGQGFFSNISGAVKDLAPVLLPVLTAGFGAPLAAALGVSQPVAAGLIAGGVTAVGGGDIGDIAKAGLTAGAANYASSALLGGDSLLTPEMQATISSNPQGAFLGESAIPSSVTTTPVTGYELGALASPVSGSVAGSAADAMTGIDMSGNVVNALTGEPLAGAGGAGFVGFENELAGLAAAEAGMSTPGAALPGIETALTSPGTFGSPSQTSQSSGRRGFGRRTSPVDTGDAGFSTVENELAGLAAAEAAQSTPGAALPGIETALAGGATGVDAYLKTAEQMANADIAARTDTGATQQTGTDGTTFGVANELWGPIIGSIASLYGGSQAADAARDAARIQAESIDKATQLQRDIYEKGIELQRPFYEGGKEAFNRLTALSTGGPQAAQNFLTMDPGYGFRLSEGMKALDRLQSARGGMLSGGAIKAGQRYAQDVASQEYGSAYNRLAQLADVGPRAAGVTSQLGQNYATSAGNLMSQQGTGSANALLAGAAARQSAYGDIGNIWGRYFGGGK